MKIVVFGLTISSTWGNRHADTWRGLSRALAQRGHRISFYERDSSVFALHRDLGAWGSGQLWLFTSWDKIRYRARRDLEDADVAIVTSACPDAPAAIDLVMSSPVPMRIFHDLDTAATLDYEESDLPVMYAAPERLDMFDLVLSSTGGRALDELQSHLRARRVAALYAAVDPDHGFQVHGRSQPPKGLSYLADQTGEDALAVKRFLIEPARRLPHRVFRVGGNTLQPATAYASNVIYERVLNAAARTAFYQSSRLLLSLAGKTEKRMGFCPPELLFHAAAGGTPVLSENWEGLNLFLEPGEEVLIAESTEDAVNATELLDGHLAQIGGRARERVLDEHTFAQRARHFEALLENTANAANESLLDDVRQQVPFEDAAR